MEIFGADSVAYGEESRCFPYRENETQRTPYITFAIIALNVITWLFFQGAGQARPLAESVCNRGLIAGGTDGYGPAGNAASVGQRAGVLYRCRFYADLIT